MLYQLTIKTKHHETINQRLHHSHYLITHLPFGAKFYHMVSKRGRKLIDPNLKKAKLQIYVEQHKINELGGLDESQKQLFKLFNNYYAKKTIRDRKLEA